MCVAVIVQDNKRIPKENLKLMSDANPHGGGIAWYDGDIVHYRKGMTWEEIDAVQDKLPRPFLMHFRIATKGDKIPELTHPFPIGWQAFSEDLVGIAEKGVIIHNGTWSDYHKYLPNGLDIKAVSDTQVAAYVAAFDESILDEVRWSNAIMTSDGIKYRGQWSKHEDNMYSNLGWQRTYNWDNDYGYFYGSRTTTPITPRKKGLSHQQGHNQSGGKTQNQNQYQTQFNKAGRGVNTLQSNGKTIQENRARKSKKPANSNSSGASPYDKARNSYQGTMNLGTNADENMTRYRGRSWEEGGNWKGERLFDPAEIPGYKFNVEKFLGKSVKCPDCNEEIVTIPCACNLEAALEALDLEMEAEFEEALAKDSDSLECAIPMETMDECAIPMETIDEYSGPIPQTIATEITARITRDAGDVEDLNAYGMSLGVDAMPGDMSLGVDAMPGDMSLGVDAMSDLGVDAMPGPRCGCGCEGPLETPDDKFLDPDWKDIQEMIARDGIKFWGSD